MITSCDTRAAERNQWVLEQLKTPDFTLTPIQNDASCRQYYRVAFTDKTHILMDAPPQQENCEAYYRIAQWLKEAELLVPEIFAHDLNQGFLLLTDFGDRLLLAELNEKNVAGYYHQAMYLIMHLQK